MNSKQPPFNFKLIPFKTADQMTEKCPPTWLPVTMQRNKIIVGSWENQPGRICPDNLAAKNKYMLALLIQLESCETSEKNVRRIKK